MAWSHTCSLRPSCTNITGFSGTSLTALSFYRLPRPTYTGGGVKTGVRWAETQKSCWHDGGRTWLQRMAEGPLGQTALALVTALFPALSPSCQQHSEGTRPITRVSADLLDHGCEPLPDQRDSRPNQSCPGKQKRLVLEAETTKPPYAPHPRPGTLQRAEQGRPQRGPTGFYSQHWSAHFLIFGTRD